LEDLLHKSDENEAGAAVMNQIVKENKKMNNPKKKLSGKDTSKRVTASQPPPEVRKYRLHVTSCIYLFFLLFVVGQVFAKQQKELRRDADANTASELARLMAEQVQSSQISGGNHMGY
jgi:hypothetical protein